MFNACIGNKLETPIRKDCLQAPSLKKVIFLRPGKLGDMIVASPLFKELKKHFPDMVISVAASPYNEIIIKENPYVTNCFKVNFHSLFSIICLVFKIRKEKYSWVIDLTPGISRTSSVICKLVKSKYTSTAGMHKGQSASKFTKTTDFSGIHILERNKKLIEEIFKIECSGIIHPEVYFSDKHQENADAILNVVENRSDIIGVNCSAGEPERQWTKDKYNNLLELIKTKYPERSIILFSVGEQYLWAMEFQKQFKKMYACPQKDFLTIAAVIKKVGIFITPDTSLLHVAAGYKIPVVGLYCVDGENLVRWRAYETLSKELVARGSHDVNEIAPSEVFRAFEEIMNNGKDTR
jgi:ADP-heptose:LPS heptosyltransferase